MIEIKDLKFGYKRHKPVIEDVALRIPSGFIHGLLGKNGIGKSTLLKLIAGLRHPDEGEINVMGFCPGQRKAEFFQELFFLPEELETYKVSIDNFLRLNSVFYPRFSKEEFYSYLKEFEIEDTKAKLSTLSFGTKKKVIIAFGLAANTKLLLMDEPTNGLDIPSKAQFRKIILKAMNADRTIMISTHQVRDLHNLIDNVLIMDEKNIIINSTINEITSKLSFGYERDLGLVEGLIYSEDNVNGYSYVAENLSKKESDIDIEMFFNTIFTQKDRILELFDYKNKERS